MTLGQVSNICVSCDWFWSQHIDIKGHLLMLQVFFEENNGAGVGSGA